MDLQTLRNQVRDLLSEDSSNLTDSMLDDLIERCTQRAEQDFADDYGVTPRQMLESVTGTITANGYQLPSDWLRARTVKRGDDHLRYRPLEDMPQDSAGEGSEVYITYYKQIPKLVNDTDTNWLLDRASRLYVFGTALEYTYWNRESEQDRGRYFQEYNDSMQKVSRSNSPRPSGGFGRTRGRQHGFYSIRGDYMIFGYG